jgi:branched-chain amino acid transport system ATP-binding protein
VSLLEVRGLAVAYGGIKALHGIDLRVEEGEIVALLGSNGAGKTTTLRAISGLIRPAAGEIAFDGAPLRGVRADTIARRGLRHVPEGRRVFARMTVRENLELGAFRTRTGNVRSLLDEVFETFPRLRERIDQTAGTLSGGEQQMLAIGRALMGSPRLLMLDEPSLGLSPLLVQTIFGVISTIHQRGTTVLLVEQNARQALRIASRAYVLENGRVAREGRAADLLDDASVIAAYLGMAPAAS